MRNLSKMPKTAKYTLLDAELIDYELDSTKLYVTEKGLKLIEEHKE